MMSSSASNVNLMNTRHGGKHHRLSNAYHEDDQRSCTSLDGFRKVDSTILLRDASPSSHMDQGNKQGSDTRKQDLCCHPTFRKCVDSESLECSLAIDKEEGGPTADAKSCLDRGELVVSSSHGDKSEHTKEDEHWRNKSRGACAATPRHDQEGHADTAPKNAREQNSFPNAAADGLLSHEQERLKKVRSTLREATMVAMLVDKALTAKRVINETYGCDTRTSPPGDDSLPSKRRRYQRRNSVVILPKQMGQELGQGVSVLGVQIGVIENNINHRHNTTRTQGIKVARAG